MGSHKTRTRPKGKWERIQNCLKEIGRVNIHLIQDHKGKQKQGAQKGMSQIHQKETQTKRAPEADAHRCDTGCALLQLFGG